MDDPFYIIVSQNPKVHSTLLLQNVTFFIRFKGSSHVFTKNENNKFQIFTNLFVLPNQIIFQEKNVF